MVNVSESSSNEDQNKTHLDFHVLAGSKLLLHGGDDHLGGIQGLFPTGIWESNVSSFLFELVQTLDENAR